MPTLYEIDQAIMECIDLETGELIDPERLDLLQMERSQKIENVALWIKNLQSDALAFKAEKEAFAEREKAATKKAEQLKAWLATALNAEKFSTTRCAVSFRWSEGVDITDESLVPKKYMSKTITYKPDKAAIKQAIVSGKSVKGCGLYKKLNTHIK